MVPQSGSENLFYRIDSSEIASRESGNQNRVNKAFSDDQIEVEKLVLENSIGCRNGIERYSINSERAEHRYIKSKNQTPIRAAAEIPNQRCPKEIFRLGAVSASCFSAGAPELVQPDVDQYEKKCCKKGPKNCCLGNEIRIADRGCCSNE